MKRYDLSLQHNLGYKIVALIMAVLLWFYVLQTQDTDTERLFTVALETRGLSANLTVADLTSQVKVRVKGSKQDLAALNQQDIHAYIVMDNAPAGQRTETVQLTLPDKVEKVSVSPSSVTVNIEKLVTRQLPVQVVVKGDLKTGYTALTPSVTPTEAIIAGPSSKLDQVKVVYVEANVAGLEANYLQKLPIIITMNDGKQNDASLTSNPTEVAVFIPVVADLPSKMVPVTARITGSPASDYAVSRVVVEPAVVKALGAYTKLDVLSYLYTGSVDISGATDDVTIRSTINLPEGITIDGENAVNVFVQIEKNSTKTVSGVPLEVRNLDSGLAAKLTNGTANIVVKGTPTVLQGLTASDIRLFIDAQGLAAGDHTLTIHMETTKNISMTSIDFNTVNVTISKP